jgi:hypothetical protein
VNGFVLYVIVASTMLAILLPIMIRQYLEQRRQDRADAARARRNAARAVAASRHANRQSETMPLITIEAREGGELL